MAAAMNDRKPGLGMAGIALALSLGLAGCGSFGSPPAVADTACGLRNQPRSNARPLPPSQPARVAALGAHGFSQPALIAADTIGALEALEALLRAETRRDGAVDYLLARHALSDAVLLSSLDVQAILANIACEGERADQLQVNIERIQARRERNLSFAAVALGGISAALSGGLSLGGLGTAADIAGLVGGVAEAGTAGALLFGGASGRLRLSQNLFPELLRQPEHSAYFPPRVWRYLTRRPAPGAPNIIDELFADWRANGLLGTGPDDPATALLMSDDGLYDADDLGRREAIYDQLDARVALMNRDLRALLDEVVARPLPQFGTLGSARMAARSAR